MQFQESEQIFTVLDDVPLGCFALSPDYEVIFWNRQLEIWTGVSRDDILNTPIADRYPHLTVPKYTTRLQGVFEGGPPVVFSSQLHHHMIPVPFDDNFRVQHTTVTPVSVPGRDACNALFSIQDVTEISQRIKAYGDMHDQAVAEVQERKKTEEKLRASETELRAMFATMPELILLVDHHSTILRVINPGDFADKLRVEKLVGRTPAEMLSPDMATAATINIQRALASGKANEMEYQGRLRGQDLWLKASFSPIDKQRVVCVIRNVTEDKIAQQQATQLAIERERAELVGDFIQGASHDFRTSLSVMNTNLYLLERSTDDTKRAERRGRLKNQVRHLENLVESLLTIYRWDTTESKLKLGRFQVQSMLHNLEVSFSNHMMGDAVELRFLPTDSALPIHADEQELTHAMRALIENAFNFTEAGTITVSAEAKADELHIIVVDTGLGIPADEYENIFKLFYKVDQARTNQVGGLGLGLSIAQRIIHAHSGHIRVESTPGQGSTFTIILPGAAKP